ncbi:hypothetical protein D9M71_776150 [compost metagenome]
MSVRLRNLGNARRNPSEFSVSPTPLRSNAPTCSNETGKAGKSPMTRPAKSSTASVAAPSAAGASRKVARQHSRSWLAARRRSNSPTQP